MTERLAIIFDDTLRPDTTGMYCLRALQRLASVEHIRPERLPTLSAGKFDLFLFIDDGLEYQIPDNLRPSALWAIDTHFKPERIIARALGMDFVFSSQKSGVELLRRRGIRCLEWLPLACDPEIHAKHSLTKEFDVSFVAHFNTARRLSLAQLIRSEFPSSFVGQCFFDKMAQVYSQSKVVVNLSVAGDLNMRVFEAMSCGSLLLTDMNGDNGIHELLQEGIHFEGYRDDGELIDKIRYFVTQPAIREHIASTGYREVTAQHTYEKRMARLLRCITAELWPGRTLTSSMMSKARSGIRIASDAIFPAPMSKQEVADLGCVLAAQNRPPEYLERALQCFASQDISPGDRVFVDYGSEALIGEGYRGVCAAYGWRYVRVQPSEAIWSSSAAYNAAISNLSSDIRVVFKTDIDFCPGPGVLRAAVLRGRTRLCSFTNVFATPPDLSIPDTLVVEDLHDIAQTSGCRHMETAGIVAFPRDWFADIGGYDLFYKAWGYEDTDLQERAARSIGVTIERFCFLIHQWHPRNIDRDRAEKNHRYLKRMQTAESVIRNADAPGSLFSNQTPPPSQFCKDVPGRSGLAGDAEAATTTTTIVMVTHNEYQYTKQCLESIRRHTPEPYEIVVVDNGSTDGTPETLASQGYCLIRNATNRGFPAAVNQGMQTATGKYILLLNNDVIVTDGWLQRLLRTLNSDPNVGIVGPVSNCVGGSQQISTTYETLGEMNRFSQEWAIENDRCSKATNRLIGFCMLFRRSLVDEIGYMDERFGIGNFEDDDFSLRARRRGYRLLIARDSFIHHYGSRTFLGAGIDHAGLLRHNHKIFNQKWQEADAPARQSGSTASVVPATASLLADRRSATAKISLCMIVRNSSRTLKACLDSVRPHVDEMIVVDTGSTDDTPVIAAACGAKVFHFPWCDSFAAARNESLRHASGEWIFWMDSDDTIDAANGGKLRELVRGKHEESHFGFVMQVHCPGSTSDGAVTRVDHIKMFRNDPRLQFEGRIHEQILPSIRRLGGDVKWTDVFVVHSGSDHSADGKAAKHNRDLCLLELELADKPGHSFTLFNLGMTLADAGRHIEAVAALSKALDAAQPGESHIRKLFALLIGSLLASGDQEQAQSLCAKALTAFPDDPELLFRSGVMRQESGDHSGAIGCFEKILAFPSAQHFGSVDSGILGFKTRHNLALLKFEEADLAAAEALWREALNEAPDFLQAWTGLIDLLCGSNRIGEAIAECETMSEIPSLECESWLQRARIHELQGRSEDAEACLATAHQLAPEEPSVLRALAQLCFHKGELHQAETYLQSVLARSDDDAAAHHNLACVLARLGREDDAVAACKQSLQLRPNSRITKELLGQLVGSSPGAR